LHGSSHQLPKLACRTCKKKFHSACLYKWFSTSNNSTCPLCRNLF
jgi:E3 ubiquitin-protein ligase DOA10